MYLRVKMKNQSDGMDIYGEPDELRKLHEELSEYMKKEEIFVGKDWTLRMSEACCLILKDIEPPV